MVGELGHGVGRKAVQIAIGHYRHHRHLRRRRHDDDIELVIVGNDLTIICDSLRDDALPLKRDPRRFIHRLEGVVLLLLVSIKMTS